MDTKPIKSRSIVRLGYDFGLGFLLSIATVYGMTRILAKIYIWGYHKWFAPLGIHI
jgi:hypothetical protein